MASLRSATLAALLTSGLWAADAQLDTPEDLASQYYNIFKTGNRNAASHLWSSFILERAASMPAERLSRIFRGFCAVSGSVIPDDPRTQYKVTLQQVTGETVTGVVRHCCWPCICDMNEHVHVDTKTINLADGPRTFDFLVIGDPCMNEAQLAQSFVDPFSGLSTSLRDAASEVVCEAGKLKGAVFSDHGHPIIGMLFTDGESLATVTTVASEAEQQDPTFGFGQQCMARQQQGYNSGMGLIFHLVSQITPIPGTAALALPAAGPTFASAIVQQVAMAPRAALPPVLQTPQARGSHLAVATLASIGAVSAAVVAASACRRRGGIAQQAGESAAELPTSVE